MKTFFEKDFRKKRASKYLDALDSVTLVYKMDVDGNISFANKKLLEISKYTFRRVKKSKF